MIIIVKIVHKLVNVLNAIIKMFHTKDKMIQQIIVLVMMVILMMVLLKNVKNVILCVKHV